MATETQNPASQVENPKKTLTLTTSKTLDLNQESEQHQEQPESGNGDDIKEGDDSKATGGPTEGASAVSPTGGTANNIQKKMKRAERFGVPVQLSEEEKRNSRAERFGTVTGSEASKTSEEQKRKARAERFGLSVPAEEEAKKKSRVERFGSDTKVDTAEEEKRKARALRFSQQPANAVPVPHVNGNGDSGPKTAIAGDTTGGV